MKQMLLLIFSFLLLSVSAMAQNTTQEEFDFMLKGAKSAMERGRDIKKGYYLHDTTTLLPNEGMYTITFINIMRAKDQSYAGIISAIQSTNSGKVFYVAIPVPNTTGHIDLETTLMHTINQHFWDAGLKKAFYKSLAEYVSNPLTIQGLGKLWTNNAVAIITSQIDQGIPAQVTPFIYNSDNAGDTKFDIVFTKVEQEAMFTGGANEWRKFLEKNVNANVAVENGAKVGSYTIKLQFIVDREGNIHNVHAVEATPGCPSCVAESERVMRIGPAWIPAMQNGRTVNYQAVQLITFEVLNR